MKTHVVFSCLLVVLVMALLIWFLVKTEQPLRPKKITSLPKSELVHSVAQSGEGLSKVTPSAGGETSITPTSATNSDMRPQVLSQNVASLTNSTGLVMVEPVLKERVAPIKLFTSALVVAIRQYWQEFGEYPSGDNRSISAALTGTNPKKTVFILAEKWMNKQGELVDPWGKPLSFNFESNSITIKSSGPNLTFGDEDGLKQHFNLAPEFSQEYVIGNVGTSYA